MYSLPNPLACLATLYQSTGRVLFKWMHPGKERNRLVQLLGIQDTFRAFPDAKPLHFNPQICERLRVLASG